MVSKAVAYNQRLLKAICLRLVLGIQKNLSKCCGSRSKCCVIHLDPRLIGILLGIPSWVLV